METQFTKREYSKAQASLMTKASLIAGLFFIIIGLGGWGFSYIFKDPQSQMRTFLPIFLLLMVGGMVISLLWTKVMFQQKRSSGTIALIFILYTVMEALSFGYIFGLVRQTAGMKLIPVAFAITGGMFLFTALIGKCLSMKGVFTFGKLIGAIAIAMTICMIVSLILGIIGLATGSGAVINAYDSIFMLCMVGLSIITFAYIAIDIWTISKMSEFMQYQPEFEGSSVIVWYTAFRLLTDLLNLLLLVCWWLIRLARR